MVLASDGQDRAGHTVWGLGEASDGIHGQDHDGLAAAGRHLTLTLILAFFYFLSYNWWVGLGDGGGPPATSLKVFTNGFYNISTSPHRHLLPLLIIQRIHHIIVFTCDIV